MWKRLVVQRKLIGTLGLICLITSSLLLIATDGQQGGLGGSLLRAGLVLSALWMALPQQQLTEGKAYSIWQILGFLSIVVAVVRRPLVVLPILIILGIIGLFARHRT